ncbi:MAG: sigma-70 family RNA polymerase sigma factor [Candidatus Poribacteria bacterium]|nr:sigma-70 family RNA polymerase sigma factor [Candidatus Poribacteria bacterium]
MPDLDDELMRRCQQGDLEAFDLIVRRNRIPLVTFIARFLGDQETAEDLAQETFVRMFKAIKRYRPGAAKFSTWMYHIASNLCKNELRNRGRRGRFFVDSVNREESYGPDQDKADLIATAPAHVSLQPETQLEQKEREQAVQNAIEELPERYRLPLILRDLQGLSYEEISESLSLPLGTTKSRINRARLMLKDKLRNFVESS